jgi:hypothetical protein
MMRKCFFCFLCVVYSTSHQVNAGWFSNFDYEVKRLFYEMDNIREKAQDFFGNDDFGYHRLPVKVVSRKPSKSDGSRSFSVREKKDDKLYVIFIDGMLEKDFKKIDIKINRTEHVITIIGEKQSKKNDGERGAYSYSSQFQSSQVINGEKQEVSKIEKVSNDDKELVIKKDLPRNIDFDKYKTTFDKNGFRIEWPISEEKDVKKKNECKIRVDVHK